MAKKEWWGTRSTTQLKKNGRKKTLLLLLLLARSLCFSLSAPTASTFVPVVGRGVSAPLELERPIERGERAWTSKRAREREQARKEEKVERSDASMFSLFEFPLVCRGRRRRRPTSTRVSLSTFLSQSPHYLPSIVLANSEASAQLENFSPVIAMEEGMESGESGERGVRMQSPTS